MTEPIKLCCDCRFYKKDWYARITGYGDTFDFCVNPHLVAVNPVSGKTKGGFCDTMRKFHGCGMDAKYFEARK